MNFHIKFKTTFMSYIRYRRFKFLLTKLSILYFFKLFNNPLWKLLIDHGIKKSEMREMTSISSASIAKLNKGENITTGILLCICEALDCDITDSMELVRE